MPQRGDIVAVAAGCESPGTQPKTSARLARGVTALRLGAGLSEGAAII